MDKITIEQYKFLKSQGEDVDDKLILKAIDCEVKAIGSPEERIIRFVASTKKEDRHGDTVNQAGWDLKHYNRKGVFLWAHNIVKDNPPLAKPLKAFVEKGKLKTDVQFFPPDYADHDWIEFSNMIYNMYKDKIMNDVSVGFNPTKYEFAEDRDGFMPMNFFEQELLEVSAVPIGANKDVGVEFIKAQDAGIDISPVIQWTEKLLDGDAKLWLPRPKMEKFYKTLKSSSVQVPDDIKGVISYNSAHSGGTSKAPKEEAWDGPKEVAAADVDDLKVMCTWVDSEDAENKGAYKLPHHKAGGGHSVVWNGVKAAMGALMGARGGVDIPDGDRRGVYNHLAKHYDEFDEEAPDFKEVEADDEKDADVESVKGIEDINKRLDAVEEEIKSLIKMIHHEIKRLEDGPDKKAESNAQNEALRKSIRNILKQEIHEQLVMPVTGRLD